MRISTLTLLLSTLAFAGPPLGPDVALDAPAMTGRRRSPAA